MVPFGIQAVILQFGEPQWQVSSLDDSSPCRPLQSKLDSPDMVTIPRDPILADHDEFDCGLPLKKSRDSNYSLVMDNCERGIDSSLISLPLSSLTADEISDATQSLPISNRSQVSFSKRVECFEICTLDSYSDEEYDAMWYNPEESLAMRNECIRTVEVMLGNVFPDDDEEICFRGLECKTGHPLQARSQRKALSRKSVLEEQEFDKDPDAISVVAQKYSAPSVEAAIQIAKRDHSQDCDQWLDHFDEDEWTYSNEIVKKSWLHAALPKAPKLNCFSVLRNPITV